MPDLVVHRVGVEDWTSHRDLRLEMLRDAPDAFWTEYSEVVDRTEAEWREAIASSPAHFQVRRNGMPLGSVGSWQPPGGPRDTTTLVAMYVRPHARRHGVGRLLVQAVLDDAQQRGHRCVELEVTSSNAPAIQLYLRMGFSFTGSRRPHRRAAGLEELGMRRLLDPSTATATGDLQGYRP